MKIEYIYIDGYKNLKKFEVQFNKGCSFIALIGNNGSGKSNILEALTIIFSSIQSEMPIEFIFQIKYQIDDNSFDITNRQGALNISRNKKLLTKKEKIFAMPGTIFLYYSGETIRMKNLVSSHIDKTYDNSIKKGENTKFKFLTYTSTDDFGAALLSCKIFNEKILKFLFDIVQVEAIHFPIKFIFKKPYWSNRKQPDDFWGAKGTVRIEINKLISISEHVVPTNSGDQMEILISNTDSFQEKWFASLDLLISLKMLMDADILEKIEFDVQKIGSKHAFSYTALSEGEKQLGLLISLLSLTNDYKTLFLLDEFDSYLHPSWQREFANMLRKIQIKGQLIFTTHSPFTLSKMKKEEIIILKNAEAFIPSVDSHNRDVVEVLEELMEVGRRSTEISSLISEFNHAAIHADNTKAQEYYKKLTALLSKDDPFFIKAHHLMPELELE